ncbi:DJ-1 family glyoxalase III [Nannocystis sp.]|uniref:DJ-1 family glyoxalase III n=1 Tax=Nannocystis sp. TaxID=1962667 RepID=UPI0025DDF0C3|nr:DJ-1 family glyoxalase III [Nannocystis sp.]
MTTDDMIEEIEDLEPALPRALVVLAEGAEEAEAVIIVDVLRRAGIDTTLASLGSDTVVQLSRKVRIVADVTLAAVTGSFEALVLPGGAEGARRLCASELVGERLRTHSRDGRIVAAICAAPLAFQAHQVFAGRSMTCHPTVASRIAAYGKLERANVVEDGNLITSQGPGTSFLFALAIVRRVVGEPRAAEVERGLVLAR